MKKRLKAEVWDKMQFLFRNYYDRTMHISMCYDKKIDLDVFKKVIKYMVDSVPVLHSSFHYGAIKPHWEVEEFKLEDFLSVEETASDKLWDDIFSFSEQSIDYKSNVQLRVKVFNHENGSAVAYIINHMCFDGGDVKYFTRKVSENYNALLKGEPFVKIKSGSRSCDAIYSKFNKEDEKIARGLYKNISAVKSKDVFPLTKPDKNDKSMIVTRTLNAEDFDNLKKIGKTQGLTVNDLLTAIYIHSLYKYCKFNAEDYLAIPCMVDLRRYIKDAENDCGLANHTGFMICDVKGYTGDIIDTMNKVAISNKKNKEDKFMGIYSIPLLKLAYQVFPHCIAEIAIKIGYDNPLIGMSNIGQFGHELDLGDAVLTDGFATGAIKYKPFMQLALATFLGRLKISICVRGNAEDKKIINEFFDTYESVMKEYIEKNKQALA